jgi:dihydroxyacetone kinase
MTALDMRGVSITVLELDAALTDLLAMPVGPRAWPGLCAVGDVAVRPMPDGLAQPSDAPSENAARGALVLRGCAAMIAAEGDLNTLDAKSGDGDTGSTLAVAARALMAALDRLPLADDAALCRAIGAELAQTMGGSSGVLMAIFFGASGDAAANGAAGVAALRAGLDRVMEVGGAQPGDRTMIDALAPALDALPGGVAAAAQAARVGADSTADMTRAAAGRAAYASAATLAGHVDPGAEAVARLFRRLADG